MMYVVYNTAAVLFVSAVALVSAQSATPACLTPCYSSALAASGSSCEATNLTCLCQDFNFQVAAVKCFKEECSDLTETVNAENFGEARCASVGITLDQNAIQAAVTSSIGASATSTGASATGSVAATTTATLTAASSTSITSAASAATGSVPAATSSAASLANKLAVTGLLGFISAFVAFAA